MEDIPCSSKDADQATQYSHAEKRTQHGKQLYGGKNCCVPQCTNSNLRNPELSFYKIPKDSTLKKKWEKLLQTKGLLNIGPHYRVCSVHFSGGKKTYTTNVPTIFVPKITHTPRKKPNRQQIVLEVTTSNMEVITLDMEVTTSNMEVTTSDME
ncbi:THAP domain-containing 11, partial [Paramuricea clavata]